MLTKEVQLSITLENDSYNPSLFFCGRTVINPLQNLGLDITGMALMNKKGLKICWLTVCPYFVRVHQGSR